MHEDQRRSGRGRVETSIRTARVWESVLLSATARAETLGHPLRVLDLGGGTGGLAVLLAQHGHNVTVVDPSPDALAALGRRIREAGVADRVRAVQGDALNLGQICAQNSVDLVCCHDVLEVVDDPAGTVQALAAVLGPGGVVSLVAAQRLAAVLARALAGRFGQAMHALDDPDGRWGQSDPLPRRFDLDDIEAMVHDAGLVEVQSTGVRLFGDLVPSAFVDSENDRLALLELERSLAAHPDYAFVTRLGAAVHVLARKPE